MSMKNIELLTDIKQIPNATDNSLKRSLITCEGYGEMFREAALKELLKRANFNGFREGVLSDGRDK